MDSAITTLTPASEPVAGAEAGNPARDSVDSAINKEMFLQLLVAQIRHQNPMDPSTGTEFLTQLAQFTSLEQMIGIRQELEAIRAAIEAQDEDAEAEASPA
jgi:flagellar basal-body rod modification protein FlgD